MFSQRYYTFADIKKRLAVPSAIQRSLPPFNGGKLWKNFVIYDNLMLGIDSFYT
ncbi:hypothetical protein Godav_003185 [Gossypium davidsonii]|uniref:Uncharacterized protein n=1 Tax=Gossypium davidsonii TaxID=34287 RepID=A0A7J8SYF2_GOSDV|nr:hypothetical protein [Gossypium davidsonii]